MHTPDSGPLTSHVQPSCAPTRGLPLAVTALAVLLACSLAVPAFATGDAAPHPAAVVPAATGAKAQPAAKAPAASKAAPSGAQAETLAEGRHALELAAKEKDPAKAKAKAASAAAILQPLAAARDAGCEPLLRAAEAQLRAENVTLARDDIERAQYANCDVGATAGMHAWLTEFNDAGVRRGPGANLVRAQSEWASTGLYYDTQKPPVRAMASQALMKAADLAQLRGALDQCKTDCLRALRDEPTGDDQMYALTKYVECATVSEGEGAALDDVLPYAKDRMQDLMAQRIEKLGAAVDENHKDGPSQAALGFYSLIANPDKVRLRIADRNLKMAIDMDPNLPDLWYLVGRLRDAQDKLDEAMDAFRRQIHDHPDTPATRLAVNQLAHLVATSGGSEADKTEALQLLDGQLAKTPDEAVMLGTRAQLLAAMGRTADARAALDRALTADPSLKSDAEIAALQSKLGGAPAAPAPAHASGTPGTAKAHP